MRDSTGSRLKALRIRYGLSQKDLAEQLGYSVSTISNWECDRTIPRADCIVDIAQFYKVSVEYILCG